MRGSSPHQDAPQSWFYWFDIFTKYKDEAIIRTTSGGLVSIIGAILMALLFFSELHDFVSPHATSRVTVDDSAPYKLLINFDITLDRMPCEGFGVDALDSAGDVQLEVEQDVEKIPLAGRRIGCTIHGTLLVNKVAGEFHIAFGRKAVMMQRFGDHLHEFTLAELQTFNPSHIINHLSFGEDFPGVHQPLDDFSNRLNLDETARFLYFIKIVPTIYKFRNGQELRTNQYSYTLKNIPVNLRASSFMQPGIFFKYEISAYMVVYEEESRGLVHFLTSCAAIIGGVFVVAGLIASAINIIRRKLFGQDSTDELGSAYRTFVNSSYGRLRKLFV